MNQRANTPKPQARRRRLDRFVRCPHCGKRYGKAWSDESELTDFCDRIRTVADEAFGPFPHQTATEAINKIEAGIFEQRRAIAVALAALERLRDCDWVVSLPDRMDAVRTIASDAISAIHSYNPTGQATATAKENT